MSFLSTLQQIGAGIVSGIDKGIHLAQPLAPVIALFPGGTIANTVIAGILAAEQAFPQPGIGAAKAEMVTAATVAEHPEADPNAVKNAITQIVGALNSLGTAAPAKP